jgi:hypothetical protein
MTPQVLTVELEQVEGAKDCTRVCTISADQLKDGKPVSLLDRRIMESYTSQGLAAEFDGKY